MYDLRYLSANISFSHHPPRRKPPAPPPTPPILTYPTPHPAQPQYHHLGFDIDTSLNLVAAATPPGPVYSSSLSGSDPNLTDEGATGIMIYALHTGEVVRRIGGDNNQTDSKGSGGGGVVRCLRFADVGASESGRARRALAFSRGSRVKEWAW